MSDYQAEQLYHALIKMHGEAFESARYELGYHLLAAAFHAADELDDLALLTAVGTLAETRQQEVNSLTPEHHLSSAAAGRRGTHPLYTTLTAIVHSARGRIEADRARERVHQKSFGDAGARS